MTALDQVSLGSFVSLNTVCTCGLDHTSEFLTAQVLEKTKDRITLRSRGG